MKLKSQMMFVEIEKETVGLPVGDKAGDFSGLIKVNATAKDIIGFLKEDITMDELVKKMSEIYDAPEDRLRTDIQKVIGILDSQGLIEK